MKRQNAGKVNTRFLEHFNNITTLKNISIALDVTEFTCVMNNHFVETIGDEFNTTCSLCDKACKRCFGKTNSTCFACSDGYSYDKEKFTCNKQKSKKHVSIPGWGIALILVGCILLVASVLVGIYIFQKKKLHNEAGAEGDFSEEKLKVNI